MPDFAFAARDTNGQPHSGVLSANSAGDLVTQLRGRGWVVVNVAGAEAPGFSGARLLAALQPVQWLRPAPLDVELGCKQLGTMLRSGLTLLMALRTAAEQARRPSMGRVWRRVAERIEEGSTFAEALNAQGRLFPQMVVQLVRVGEASGTLDSVMSRAATQMERSRLVKTTLLTSLMYPSLVLVAAVTVTAYMVFGLIPKLQRFLAVRGRALPPMSQMLLDFSAWANANGTWILGVAAALLLLALLVYRIPRARARIDRALLHVPIVGRLLRLAGTTTAARGLSVLLGSGISLLSALQTVRSLLVNRAMQARLVVARENVLGGGALADAFLKGREFMPMLGRMLAVGEATSTLGNVLDEVADFHEDQLAASVRRFSALVEPVTLLVVGGIVGFVYVAFFLALFAAAAGGG